MLKTGIGPDIYTAPFTRINLAPALVAATAGAVALVLRALRHGAEVRHIDQGAIAAIPAVVQKNLGPVLQLVKDFLRGSAVHGPGKPAHESE